MQKKIRVGLLGTGFMCKAHGNAYRTIPYMFPQLEGMPVLDTVASSVQEHAKQAAKRYGFLQGVEGWEAAVNKKDIDLIDICLPEELHFEVAKAALQKGKGVLCEKPMALSSQEAAQLALLTREQGVTNMVCFNYRFLPAVRMAYEMIQQGALGKLYHMYVKYYQEGGSDPEQLYEDTWYLRTGRIGVLQGIGTHAIDQARFLLGEIARVRGNVHIYTKERITRQGEKKKVTVEDAASVLVDFKNGASGVIECSCAASGYRNSLEWEISGSMGSLKFKLEEPTYLEVYLKDCIHPQVSGFTRVNVTLPEHPFMDIWWPGGHNTGWEHGHINLIAHMLDCMAKSCKVSPYGADFTDGFRTAAIIDSIRKSSETGKTEDMQKIYRDAGL